MIYKKEIEFSRALFNWVNNAFCIDDLSKCHPKELEKANYKQFDDVGILEVTFEDGTELRYNLCSGSTNYYDDLVISKLVVNEEKEDEYKEILYNYSPSDDLPETLEVEADDDTYIVHLILTELPEIKDSWIKIDFPVGTIYAESPNASEREDPTKYKVFDTDGKYLGYWESISFDEDRDYSEWISYLTKRLKNMFGEKAVEYIFEILGVGYSILSSHPKPIADYLGCFLLDQIFENEFVNRIGNFYIFVD